MSVTEIIIVVVVVLVWLGLVSLSLIHLSQPTRPY